MSLLTNTRNKGAKRKIHKSLIFDVMKNDSIFRSNVCHFQYDPKFFFNREMRNVRACKELRLQLTKFRL